MYAWTPCEPHGPCPCVLCDKTRAACRDASHSHKVDADRPIEPGSSEENAT